MADITVTTAQVAALDPKKAVIEKYIAAEAITKGQAVYLTTAGKAGVADANASGKVQFRGIALDTVAAGDAVSVLHEGVVAGFGVSGMNGDAIAYLSDTAGALSTTAGLTSVACGRVVTLTDAPTLTKALRIFTRWSADWA